MVGMKTRVIDETKRVEVAADKAAFRNLGHAAASLRKEAARSIRTSRQPSAVGSPPHTRRGNYLRRAWRFHVDRKKQVAVIGPRASVVGTAASAHEFGGMYKGSTFQKRPTAAPALEDAAPRFAGSFRGSIG